MRFQIFQFLVLSEKNLLHNGVKTRDHVFFNILRPTLFASICLIFGKQMQIHWTLWKFIERTNVPIFANNESLEMNLKVLMQMTRFIIYYRFFKSFKIVKKIKMPLFKKRRLEERRSQVRMKFLFEKIVFCWMNSLVFEQIFLKIFNKNFNHCISKSTNKILFNNILFMKIGSFVLLQ